jgi:hypothetical protein
MYSAERSLDSVEIGRIGLRVGLFDLGEDLVLFLHGLGVRFLAQLPLQNFRVAIQLKNLKSSEFRLQI